MKKGGGKKNWGSQTEIYANDILHIHLQQAAKLLCPKQLQVTNLSQMGDSEQIVMPDSQVFLHFFGSAKELGNCHGAFIKNLLSIVFFQSV